MIAPFAKFIDWSGIQVSAPRTVEEGADTTAWLATEADQKLTGKFFHDRKEIGW